MKQVLPLAVAAMLALPAAAAAHPSVYRSDARAVENGVVVDKVRYVVSNHGFNSTVEESNGLTAGGVFDYKRLPKAYRDTLDWQGMIDNGTYGAQVHATCVTPALTSQDAIRSWQTGGDHGPDPFYTYVPFQKDAAGFDDDPADWLGTVKERTGVDLATATDPKAACEGIAPGSVYHEADKRLRTAAQFNDGLLAQHTAPLEQAVSDAQAATTAVQGLLDAARAEVAKLAAAAKPMTLALPSARAKARTLARRGTTVQVSGPAGAEVRVELRIGEVQARRLKLGSSRLAATTVTLAADGTGTATLKPRKRARRALGRVKRSIAMRVTALSGDRIATSGGTLTR